MSAPNPLCVPAFDHPPPKRVRALTEAGGEDEALDPPTYAFLRAAEAARLEVRRKKNARGRRRPVSLNLAHPFSSSLSPFLRTRPPPRACPTRRRPHLSPTRPQHRPPPTRPAATPPP